MESKGRKKVKFSLVLNIIFAVTSLIYVITSLVYFIWMIVTMTTGNEYEMLGFIFGLIFLPIFIGILIIPIFRIVTLVLSIIMNKKVQNGQKAGALCIVTGIMQILDAIVSPFVFSSFGTIPALLIEPGEPLAFFNLLLSFLIFGIAGIKSIIQFVSAILLFTAPKQLTTEN